MHAKITYILFSLLVCLPFLVLKAFFFSLRNFVAIFFFSVEFLFFASLWIVENRDVLPPDERKEFKFGEYVRRHRRLRTQI